jgi:hypothetical protein
MYRHLGILPSPSPLRLGASTCSLGSNRQLLIESGAESRSFCFVGALSVEAAKQDGSGPEITAYLLVVLQEIGHCLSGDQRAVCSRGGRPALRAFL